MPPWYKVGAEARRFAETDTNEALKIARGITDPYPRAHALAKIGHFAKGVQSREILDEARVASWSAADPYQTVDSSAGRLFALIDRGETRAATEELALLLSCADKIPHPVCRLEALSALLPAAFDDDTLRKRVLTAQIAAARAAQSWRSGARLRNAAIMLAVNGHLGEAADVIACMPDGPYRRQAIKGVAAAVK